MLSGGVSSPEPTTDDLPPRIFAVDGLSGDTNAYRSVLSAVGSCEISGASRWLDAVADPGPPRMATASPRAETAAATSRPKTSFFLTSTPFGAAAAGGGVTSA